MGIFEETQKEVSEVKKIVEELKALSEKGLSQIETDDPKSIDDIEIMTGFAKPTLYGYVRKNIIPYHKINGRLFFFKSEIRVWIKQGRHRTNLEIEADTDTLLSNKRKSKR
tara:strand:- start:20708 stop:21040 length:333 start_codon:yes stop_codon:yes gene_type:complete